MIIVQRRDGELTPTACEAPRCERCLKLEAENNRLRDLVRMIAALAGEEDLAQSALKAANATRTERW